MLPRDDVRLRLCAITDDLRDGVTGLVERAVAAERGGVTMVLLRLKHAEAQTLVLVGRALVQALSIPVVVSERLDVALACGAAGVQLHADSMPAVGVRSQVPEGFLIGGSVTDATDTAAAAHADYVTIGPIFGGGAATIGLEGFRRLVAAVGRPAIAIGGIDAGSVRAVLQAGAAGIAVIEAVFGAPDPQAAAAALIAASR